MKVLFRQRGGSLPVTDEVVKAAAGNTGENGFKIMQDLPWLRGPFLTGVMSSCSHLHNTIARNMDTWAHTRPHQHTRRALE